MGLAIIRPEGEGDRDRAPLKPKSKAPEAVGSSLSLRGDTERAKSGSGEMANGAAGEAGTFAEKTCENPADCDGTIIGFVGKRDITWPLMLPLREPWGDIGAAPLCILEMGAAAGNRGATTRLPE